MMAADRRILTRRSSNCSRTSSHKDFPVKAHHPSEHYSFRHKNKHSSSEKAKDKPTTFCNLVMTHLE